MRTLQLKLILLFRSPHDDIELRDLLKKANLIERFTPYLGGAPGNRGPVRSEEARDWLERRRNEAIAELTLAVATIGMLAAILGAARC
jgi:hypothetical protein